MEFESNEELTAVRLMRSLVEWDNDPKPNKVPLREIWRWSKAEREQRIKKAHEYFRLQELWAVARNDGDWVATNILGYKLRVIVDFFIRLRDNSIDARSDIKITKTR